MSKKKKETKPIAEEEVVDNEQINNNTENDTKESDNKEQTEESLVEAEKNKYLRLYSEFENFRKRTQKEKLELYKTAAEDVLVALLPVIDDFERAQKANKDVDDIKALKEGFELIYDKLLKTLQQKGLKAIPSSIGEKFDLELHEAITQIPAPTEKEKGNILDEVEKGYTLNDKVIRFTKVVVGQ